MTAVTEAPAPDEFHDKEWMSTRIKKTVTWIDRNLRLVPHYKSGRDVWFTEAHVAEFWKAREVKPTPGRTERSRAAARRAR